MKLRLIYKPIGKALEYIPDGYALNIYNGCIHGCTYGYCSRYRKDFHTNVFLAKKFNFKDLEDDCKQLSGQKVFLSFTSDAFQDLENEITIEVLEMFLKYNIIPVICTKGYVNDNILHILSEFEKCYFGMTLTLKNTYIIEPNAMPYNQRFNQLCEAKFRYALNTWVSLEPIINCQETIEIINETHTFIDHYKLGALNYSKDKPDYKKWLPEIIKTLNNLNCDYYIKESLKKYL